VEGGAGNDREDPEEVLKVNSIVYQFVGAAITVKSATRRRRKQREINIIR